MAAIERIEAIGNAYNRNNIDSMSDYSEVNCYLRVNLAYEVNDAAQLVGRD